MSRICVSLVLLVFIGWNYSCSRKTVPTNYPLSDRILNAPEHFFDKPDEYLDWQTENILELVEESLTRFTPDTNNPIERQMTLLLLDAVFHDIDAPNRPAVQQFHHNRTATAIDEIASTPVTKGAIIWKLYNMGVIIKTPSVVLGFDLTSGYTAKNPHFALHDTIMHKMAEVCDVLFISHEHRDHAESMVAELFIKMEKPVIAPAAVLKDSKIHDKIVHLERTPDKINNFPVGSSNNNLQVTVYPGHQGNIENNVVVVKTPEGLTFCHTGDQSSEKDFHWIDDVKNHRMIDVLIPNCWTPNPMRFANGINPEIIIPAHENELGHSIDHREAYALNYSRWKVPFPKVLMTWGEKFHYIR